MSLIDTCGEGTGQKEALRVSVLGAAEDEQGASNAGMKDKMSETRRRGWGGSCGLCRTLAFIPSEMRRY